MIGKGLRLAIVAAVGLGLAWTAVAAAKSAQTWNAVRFIDPAHPGAVFGPSALKGEAHVLMLWRADCGPCLLELENLKALEAAGKPGSVILVSLDAPYVAQDKLRALGIAPHRQLYAIGDNAQVLSAMGGPPPRLPLAVATDRGGHRCRRRIGLMGTDIVKRWVAQCS